ELFRIAALFLAPIGKIHPPVIFLLGYNPAAHAARLADVDAQVLARLQTGDAGKAGRGTGDGEEVERLIDAAQVGLRLHKTGREQGLDLGAEEKPIALR